MVAHADGFFVLGAAGFSCCQSVTAGRGGYDKQAREVAAHGELLVGAGVQGAETLTGFEQG